MDKITLKFSGHGSIVDYLNSKTVVLTLDENGKSYVVENSAAQAAEEVTLPKRVLTAFTESAIDKILAQDEISLEPDVIILDGYEYEITISKGEVTKEYTANDITIETYPLLRYLASWYRK